VEKHTFCTFGELGKIRVGVKTTADKVFVRRDWKELPPDMQPEVLRPLITHHAARRYKSLPADRQILYTHEDRQGKKTVVDLAQHPRTAHCLEGHRATLEARTCVIESGRQWFEIWVPQVASRTLTKLCRSNSSKNDPQATFNTPAIEIRDAPSS
jgi:hypothetical protein